MGNNNPSGDKKPEMITDKNGNVHELISEKHNRAIKSLKDFGVSFAQAAESIKNFNNTFNELEKITKFKNTPIKKASN